MRDITFVEKEFYHIYNRGVDGRKIISDINDLDRFMKSMREFNTIKPIGSIYENRGHKSGRKASKSLVRFIVYAINPNHFHFLIEQVADRGIEKFMHRFGTGFSKYFNAKYKRSGSLFQGKFKAKLIDTNEYLLHLSAYINLNHMAHSRGRKASILSRTSWEEYESRNLPESICFTEKILGQFKNNGEYKKFAEDSLKSIIERKILLEELESAGIELVNTK